jgi:hypothetical protein
MHKKVLQKHYGSGVLNQKKQSNEGDELYVIENESEENDVSLERKMPILTEFSKRINCQPELAAAFQKFSAAMNSWNILKVQNEKKPNVLGLIKSSQ